MKPIIRVEQLSKRYKIGSRPKTYGSLRDKIAGTFKAPFGRFRRNRHIEENIIWALNNVSFDVNCGEVVGIIGRNGAGKSTLLKILSRITEPTSGQIDLYGRVASLLEVGTGFHQELTGRENIYLNGAILGMSSAEIKLKFDEIVAFAEVDKFLDTPVKRYSSGMYVRLAFAVAAHLEPEILVIDEVLAVGDVAFQKKCLGKMNDVSKEGRTVLFVSHNMSAVGRLCHTAICLEDGKVLNSGDAQSVVAKYLASSHNDVSHQEWSDIESAPGDEFLRIKSAGIVDLDGNPIEALNQDRSFVISIVYQVLKPMNNANVGFELSTQDGIKVFTSYDADSPEWSKRGRASGVYRADCTIPANLLNEGGYNLTLAAGIPSLRLCVMEEDVLRLDIGPAVSDEGPVGRMGARRSGLIAPALDWRVCSQG